MISILRRKQTTFSQKIKELYIAMICSIKNKLFKHTLLSGLILSLFACGPGDPDSVANICESNPELCADIHKGIDCRYKRSRLIRARYYDKIAPSEAHTLALLDELDDYDSCLELTLLMEFSQKRIQKHQSVENYLTIQRLLKEKLESIQDSTNPYIAYYLWTHFQDEDAKAVFLKYAMNDNNKDAKILIKLASIYASNYPQYSLDIFYKALQLSHSLDDIPLTTFTFIMTIYYRNNNFEQAYIWALMADKMNSDSTLPINYDLILQKGHLGSKKLINNEDELKQIANRYYSQLKMGSFHEKTPQLAL